MQYHLGRLFDHVHLRISDLERSKRFYGAVLRALGLDILGEGEGFFHADELFVNDDADPSGPVHLAFQADSLESVQRFHEAGLKAGGRDNGPPGPRDYHPGYYSAYLLDPDGNNIEAVYHGPMERNVVAVVITPRE
jgi:catechol 2,3-dioxygenase-like lactoylglutathione lyase family enzyme